MRSALKFAVLASVAAIGFGTTSMGAHAQGYPTRAITVVVPFPAGGPSDVVARIVTEHMSRTLGQQMVIENVGGAGGTLGSGRVAAAQPDGYTLLAGSMGSHVSAPILTPNVRYEFGTGFRAGGIHRSRTGRHRGEEGFPGQGPARIRGLHQKEWRQREAGAWRGRFILAHGLPPVQHRGRREAHSVAYRGTGPAMNDLVGGHVDFFCEQAVSVAGQITSGGVKAYGVSASERLGALPDVPTAREAGVNYQMSIWAGIFAPKGTPKDIIEKLAAALDKALDDPAVVKRLADLGGSAPTKDERTPARFDSFVKAEIARWSPILRAASGEAK